MTGAMHWYLLDDTGRVVDDIPSSHNQPMVTPTLRGFAYGDGFFTTMGVHHGQVLWQTYHQARVQSHLKALYLHLPTDRQHTLWQAIAKFAADIQQGMVKVIISRKAQPLRGYAYTAHATDNLCLVWIGVKATVPIAAQVATFLTLNRPVSNKHSKNVILQQPSIVATCLQSRLASLPPTLAGLKSLNRLDSVLAAGELERRKHTIPDLGEGLVRDLSGNWVEGVMSNVFYQLPESASSKRWYTPPIETSGVNGVMRQVIIDRLQMLGSPVQQRYLQDDDLDNIDSMFFCNAVRGVIPVRELSGKSSFRLPL